MSKKYPLVYIEWSDAISNDEKWQPVESILHWASNKNEGLIKQTGFLLKECKDYIVLAVRISESNDDEKYDVADGALKIPRPWIHKRIDLTKAISSFS